MVNGSFEGRYTEGGSSRVETILYAPHCPNLWFLGPGSIMVTIRVSECIYSGQSAENRLLMGLP